MLYNILNNLSIKLSNWISFENNCKLLIFKVAQFVDLETILSGFWCKPPRVGVSTKKLHERNLKLTPRPKLVNWQDRSFYRTFYICTFSVLAIKILAETDKYQYIDRIKIHCMPLWRQPLSHLYQISISINNFQTHIFFRIFSIFYYRLWKKTAVGPKISDCHNANGLKHVFHIPKM